MRKGKSREEFNRYCTPIIAKFMQSKYDVKIKPIPSKLVDLADMIDNPEELVQKILDGAYRYLKKNGLKKI